MKHFVKLFLILAVFGFGASVLADHVDPVAATNKNEQTTLFKDSVGDVGGFENQINSGKNTAINGLTGSSKVLEDITGKKESEVKQDTNNLEKIRANDLESAGAKEMQEKKVIEELYINEEETLWQEHKKDANLIANASSELLSKLMDKLKEIGVDCKQVKGPKVIEPEYYIDIKKEASQDAKYDPHFCEDLRNKYNCKDELTVKCIRRGKRYSEWQYRTIKLSGDFLKKNKSSWGYGIRRCHKNWDWFITPNHPKKWGLFGYGDNKQVDSVWRDNPQAIINDARLYLVQKLEVALEQIREDIVFPPAGRGIGHQLHGYGRWEKVWNEYEFGYYYRDVADTCEEWGEEWNEECKL